MKKLIFITMIGLSFESCFDAPIKYPIIVESVSKITNQTSKYKVGISQSDYSVRAYIYTDSLYVVGDTIK